MAVSTRRPKRATTKAVAEARAAPDASKKRKTAAPKKVTKKKPKKGGTSSSKRPSNQTKQKSPSKANAAKSPSKAKAANATGTKPGPIKGLPKEKSVKPFKVTRLAKLDEILDRVTQEHLPATFRNRFDPLIAEDKHGLVGNAFIHFPHEKGCNNICHGFFAGVILDTDTDGLGNPQYSNFYSNDPDFMWHVIYLDTYAQISADDWSVEDIFGPEGERKDFYFIRRSHLLNVLYRGYEDREIFVESTEFTSLPPLDRPTLETTTPEKQQEMDRKKKTRTKKKTGYKSPRRRGQTVDKEKELHSDSSYAPGMYCMNYACFCCWSHPML